MSAPADSRRRVNPVLVVGILLVVITAWLYWPTTGYSLLIFDDDRYVTDNWHVKQGLSLETLRWVFTTFDEEFWHPLTWLTYLIDFSIHGLFAGGYHLTNLLFHAANTGLLFYALWRMTRVLWPAALVAALFGWHPLHVESVAWIAERKDLVSGFFFALTLIAYARYVEQRSAWRYLLSLLLFALGLMAKPMLVTLPCVLLLLDVWPLKRASIFGSEISSWWRLFLEKLPYLALSVACGLLTIHAQRLGGSLKSAEQVPFALRGLNALASYGRYLAKTFWPVDLCVHYPLPTDLPVTVAMISLVVLVLVTGLALWKLKSHAWLAVGWFCFLGMLVPVIGLLQVGSHAMADRYSYLPSIGVFIMLAWAGEQLCRTIKSGKAVVIGLSVAGLLACLAVSRRQMAYWQDSVTLFTREAAIYPEVPLAQGNLGVALSNAGRSAEAIEHFRRALKLRPTDCGYHFNLGSELVNVEQWAEAEAHFRTALECSNPVNDPPVEEMHNNLGVVLMHDKRWKEAQEQFDLARLKNPTYAKAYLNAGVTAEELGQSRMAYTNYLKAAELDPKWFDPPHRLARLMAFGTDASLRNLPEAIRLARQANDFTQWESSTLLETLADIYAASGDATNAEVMLKAARQKALDRGKTQDAARLEKRLGNYSPGQPQR